MSEGLVRIAKLLPKIFLQITYAGCQSEIPLNSSQLLLIPYESEDLLPICYQISYGVPEKCVEEVYFTRKLEVSDFSGAVGNYLEDHRGNLHQN